MNDIFKLFEDLIFVSDREKLIDEIEIVRREIFSANGVDGLEKTLSKQISDSRAREFFIYLNKNKKSTFDVHTIEEILESLRFKVSSFEVVTIHLPIELKRSELSEMHKKLTKLLGKPILLDIHVEPSLLGGLKLEHGGVYIDLSLSTVVKKMTLQT